MFLVSSLYFSPSLSSFFLYSLLFCFLFSNKHANSQGLAEKIEDFPSPPRLSPMASRAQSPTRSQKTTPKRDFGFDFSHNPVKESTDCRCLYRPNPFVAAECCAYLLYRRGEPLDEP